MVQKLKQALNSEGKNSLEPFSKEFKVVLLYAIKTVVSHLKDHMSAGKDFVRATWPIKLPGNNRPEA